MIQPTTVGLKPSVPCTYSHNAGSGAPIARNPRKIMKNRGARPANSVWALGSVRREGRATSLITLRLESQALPARVNLDDGALGDVNAYGDARTSRCGAYSSRRGSASSAIC